MFGDLAFMDGCGAGPEVTGTTAAAAGWHARGDPGGVRPATGSWWQASYRIEAGTMPSHAWLDAIPDHGMNRRGM